MKFNHERVLRLYSEISEDRNWFHGEPFFVGKKGQNIVEALEDDGYAIIHNYPDIIEATKNWWEYLAKYDSVRCRVCVVRCWKTKNFLCNIEQLEKCIHKHLLDIKYPNPEIACKMATILDGLPDRPRYTGIWGVENWTPFLEQVNWSDLAEKAKQFVPATDETIPLVFNNQDEFNSFVSDQMNNVGWPGSDSTVRNAVASKIMKRGFEITERAIETAIQTRMTREEDMKVVMNEMKAPYWGGNWEPFLRNINWVDEILGIA
jgi:hypothetical protein